MSCIKCKGAGIVYKRKKYFDDGEKHFIRCVRCLGTGGNLSLEYLMKVKADGQRKFQRVLAMRELHGHNN